MLRSFRLSWLDLNNPGFEGYTFLPSPEEALCFVQSFYMNLMNGIDFASEKFGAEARPRFTQGGFVLDHVKIPDGSPLIEEVGANDCRKKLIKKGDFKFITLANGPDLLYAARSLPVSKQQTVPYERPVLPPVRFKDNIIPFSDKITRQLDPRLRPKRPTAPQTPAPTPRQRTHE